MPDAGDVRFPSIDGLRAFEAAARLGTFERAAAELCVTASAVGKRIAAVEELLNTALYVRGAKTMLLTAAGKEYLEQVRAALGLLAAVPLHRRAQQRVQKLRISTPPTFARQILVPQLESFTAAQPTVELEVVLSIPFLDGGAADADVEVRNGDAARAGGTVLIHERVLPLAAPALLARVPPLRTPADLAHVPLLRTPLEPWTPWFRAAGLDWPEPSSGPKLVDLGLTLEAAVSAQGVALARPTLARHWLTSGALRPLFKLSAAPPNQYFVLAHTDTDATRAFVAWLREVCERSARDAQEALSASA